MKRKFLQVLKKSYARENFIFLFFAMYGWIRAAAILLVGIVSIYFYYVFYSWHGEDTSSLYLFLGLNILLYVSYKLFFFLFPRSITPVTPLHLLGFFLGELFLLCLCFFGFQQASIGLGIFLFFKIFFLLLAIAGLWGSIFAFGKLLVQKLSLFSHEEALIAGLVSLALGFGVYGLGLFVLAAFGAYTLGAVAFYTLFLAAVSYHELGTLWKQLCTPLIIYTHDLDHKASLSERINISQIIDELHFLVVSFLLSVNFISVYRPFPIGWDDLGAYMNYPHLLAQSGELLALGKMYFWELYTGIGFLTGSQVVAFYLNSFSGVLAGISVYFAIKYIIGEKETKFHIPLFAVMILLALPMSIFQLAKDMKLDYGLLTMSVVALTLCYHLVLGHTQKTKKQNMVLFLLLGFLIGICFAIKFTSLLLLLGVIAVLFFAHFKILGYIGFFMSFVGIFTLGGLWTLMNVIVPEISSSQKILFSLFSVGIGLTLLGVAIKYQKHHFRHLKHLLVHISCILLGFVVALFPWVVKHLGELENIQNFSLSTLLVGSPDQYIPDFTLLYSPEALKEKQELLALYSESGKVNNEDFGRYFGYEPGINNYLKLPWNLTFQVNQKGEFTDITFIFFALIPLLFIFLPFRKRWQIFPIIAFEILLLAYSIPSPISSLFSSIFSQIGLPYGYIFIATFFFLPLVYLYFTLEKDHKVSQIFLINYAFATLYVFLWSISSFGIVWYGVTMYFAFLLMISLSLYAAHTSDSETGYFGIYTSLFIVWVYILFSTFPHGITNLRTAGYDEYKLGKYTQEFSLMTQHQDYFPMLYAMNVADTHKQELFFEAKKSFLESIKDLPNAQEFITTLDTISTLPQLEGLLQELGRYNIDPKVNEDIILLRQKMYEDVMETPASLRSDAVIYRVGTFLRYFITQNHKRILEDSLLTQFDAYISDIDPLITQERLKKLGVEYMLIDLNAATIDQDPAQNLTKRYENLLGFLAQGNLKLIESDSVCLKLGLDVYNKTKDMNQYLLFAGVNHGTGNIKQQKYATCVGTIAGLISENKVSSESYFYLFMYKNALAQLGVTDLSNKEAIMKAIAPYVSQGYKALFQLSQ